jgi:hypothetical protein
MCRSSSTHSGHSTRQRLSVVNTLPQVTFLTAIGNPNPILVGDGTFFTGGTYTAAYTITSTKAPLTGFNFVVSGFVSGLGQIIWTKKVVDLNTSQICTTATACSVGRATPRQQRYCRD